MGVVQFERKPHVRIESGRITGGDHPELIGRWVYTIDYVDAEGIVVIDAMAETYLDALDAAEEFAADYGCKIIDRSEKEPTDGR